MAISLTIGACTGEITDTDSRESIQAKQELESIKQRAEQGDAELQHRTGSRYEEGYGVPEDAAEAAKWFQKAAEQEDVLAQNRLGMMYEFELGVPENKTEAVKWYQRAVEQGDWAVQVSLEGIEAQRQPQHSSPRGFAARLSILYASPDRPQGTDT